MPRSHNAEIRYGLVPCSEAAMHLKIAGQVLPMIEEDRYVNGNTIPLDERRGCFVISKPLTDEPGIAVMPLLKSEAGWYQADTLSDSGERQTKDSEPSDFELQQEALKIEGVRFASITNGRGVVGTRDTEYDVGSDDDGRWWASDDAGQRYAGETLAEAVRAAITSETPIEKLAKQVLRLAEYGRAPGARNLKPQELEALANQNAEVLSSAGRAELAATMMRIYDETKAVKYLVARRDAADTKVGPTLLEGVFKEAGLSWADAHLLRNVLDAGPDDMRVFVGGAAVSKVPLP